MSGPPGFQLGLRSNWRQFALLALVNAFVGSMVGLERTTLPLIAQVEFGLVSRSVVLSFLVSFGLVKALANLFAGRLSDWLGRKPVLTVGWLFGLPVPLLLAFAPSWDWIVFANVLLGVNQGLCWSATIIMKMDLVGPQQRGLAAGLNEFAGYLAVGLSALLTGYLASIYGLRPAPFYPGVAFALVGLLASTFLVRETRFYTWHESVPMRSNAIGTPSFARIFYVTSWHDRNLLSACQAGMVNNLNDALAWGLFPLLLAGSGLSLDQVALITAAYPAVWAISQLATGAFSDILGRKWLIVAGMGVQAGGIECFAIGQGFTLWMGGAVLLGLGTALVYPTLLAAVSDAAHPTWRATAVGIYRLWRDSGYAAGALLAGGLADLFGSVQAVRAIAALTLLSGLIVMLLMREERGGAIWDLPGQNPATSRRA